MQDHSKIKAQPLSELAELRQRVAEMEASEAKRQQANDALRESEELYRLTLKSVSDAVFVTDDAGAFKFISPDVDAIFGYSFQEVQALGNITKLLGRDLFAPAELETWREVRKIEREIVDKAGQAHNLLVTVKQVSIKGGTQLYTCHDVTNYKQAEKALRLSEEKYQALVENINDVIFSVDTQGCFTYISPAIERFARYKVEQVTGQPFARFIHPDDLASLLASFERTLAGNLEPFEFRVFASDGAVLYVRTSSRPLWKAGQLAGLTGIITDVTERKRAEDQLQRLNAELEERVRERTAQLEAMNQELRDGEARYRRLLHSVTNYVYTVQVQHGRSVSTSHGPGCVAVTGYTVSDYAADPYLWYRMIHEPDREAVTQAVNRLLAGEAVQPVEHQIHHKDGALRWIRHTLVPHFDHQGHLAAYDGLIEDITERKRAETEREALIAELETKNAELERFTYTVSHDLKSPLITIQGFLGFVEQAALAGNIEQLKADIARISGAAEKMHHLLSELLELSRIGRLTNPSEAVSWGDLAREAVNMTAGRLADRSVVVDLAPDLPVVYGDRTRLREVLENLVDNAVKFMGDQPHPRVEIGARRGGKETVLYVRDNGIGIESRYHQRVFGLFDKLDSKVEGDGVGLSVAKRIVEAHGGRIWVESEGAGKGSTFCFVLPLAGQQSLNPVPSLEKRSNHASLD